MNRTIRILVALVLSVACIFQMTFGAYAASRETDYICEVILSYGNTADEAKKWLTDNGYSYVDRNLNEGADDPIFLSKARAVFMGYKTTKNPDEAITDMKLMNMNGGYSVQDYQMILEEKKTDIQQFINQFIAVINEYRTNYKNGSSRAVAAYNMLNMLKDDDTGLLIGDLLLDKIKEEYSTEEFAALSADEQKQHADMTTILMQGNSQLVLAVEQILSSATDTNDILWLERFTEASDYDTMLETVMDEENVDPSKAEKLLSSRYDDDAKLLGSLAQGYREWLSDYSEADVKLTDSDEEITAFTNGLTDSEAAMWFTKGTQYEIINNVEYDSETSLLDLFLSDDYDLDGEDSYLLYPVISVLTDGQRAALPYVFAYQFFTMGYNTDEVAADTMTKFGDLADESGIISVFSGIDRSVYGEEVALTGEAYRLQTSGDKDFSTNWFEDGLSDTTLIYGTIAAVALVASVGCFIASPILSLRSKHFEALGDEAIETMSKDELVKGNEALEDLYFDSYKEYGYMEAASWRASNLLFLAGVGFATVSVLMCGYTLWYAYQDLKEYYHTDFTPIPMWMVDQGVNENDEKIFTYYKAVNCNRIEGKFTADNTELLKNFGDVNGDLGKQWVALYTTTDKTAGNPIVADFVTQTGKATVPGEYTALSLFGGASAQNLTDKKAGFTYNDKLGGIYLFYNTDTNAFAGSAITTGTIAVAAGCVAVAAALIVFFVYRKKKSGKES